MDDGASFESSSRNISLSGIDSPSMRARRADWDLLPTRLSLSVYGSRDIIPSSSRRLGCIPPHDEAVWKKSSGYMNALNMMLASLSKLRPRGVIWMCWRVQDALLKPRYQVVMRRADSFLDGIAWFDTDTSVAHCALSSHGYLPPVPHFKQYPLMDWAVGRGDFRLLRRLHCDSKLIKTCSYRAMRSAATRGDLEMVEWLHRHRTEHIGDMVEVVLLATTHGHVAVLDWFRVHKLIPSFLPRAIEETARAGQTEALRWLYTYLGDFADRPHQLSYLSVQSGRLDMARYVCEELGYGVTLEVLLSAALRGHDDIVRWMLEFDRETISSTPNWSRELLVSSFIGGSVVLVKFCVEELGVWSRNVAAGGLCHHLAVMGYLHTKALERATLAGTSVHDEIDFSMFSLASMLDSGQCGELVLWILRHTSEENPPKRSDEFDNFKNLNNLVSRKMVSWSFMRQYMLLRPQLCRQMRLLPQWVVQFGTRSDFHALEAIQHPKFFSKRTLRFLLAHSRDDVMVCWFVRRCDSSLLDLSVVSWAAKYGTLEILQRSEQMLYQGEQRIKVHGTVVWSAITNHQVSVLQLDPRANARLGPC